MIIECSQCHTRFKLADEKVKPQGVKVRCSKCKNVFTVSPPAPEPEEIDFGAFNMEPDGEDESPDTSQHGISEREESFSSEPSFPEGGERAVGTDIFGGSPQDRDLFFPEKKQEEEEFSSFAFGEDSAAEDAGENDWSIGMDGGEETPKSDEEESEFPSFAFGEDEAPSGPVEYSFGDENEDPGFSGFGLEDEDSSEEKYFDSDPDPSREDEDFVFNESHESPPPGDDDFDFSGIEVGSGENSQAFGDEPGVESGSAASLDVNVAEDETHGQAAARERSSAGEADMGANPPPARKARSPMGGVMWFLVFLLLALLGLASIFFWTGKPAKLAELIDQIIGPSAPAAATGQIRLSDLSGEFIKNREAGQLFVIEGKVTNDFPEARSAIAVKGILYDKDGRALLQQTVFAGNPVAHKELASMDFAAIEEKMNNQFGESLSNLNVASGQSLPITIVFRDLPSGLAEFTVETADSKPGSKQ